MKREQVNPPTVKVSVAKAHVETACRRDSHHCMVADAIKAAVPEAKYILVDLQSVRWSDLEIGRRYVYLTPPLVQSALIAFDQGKAVEPFRFTLTPSVGMTRLVGWQANHPKTSRKGKKFKKTGRKTTHRVTKERAYGVRQLEM